MTDSTDNRVLMKCIKCGYEEMETEENLAFLRSLPPSNDSPEDDHMLCPFCLNDMYRKNSYHFNK